MARLKVAHAMACKTKWEREREREAGGGGGEEIPESWHLLIKAGIRLQG